MGQVLVLVLLPILLVLMQGVLVFVMVDTVTGCDQPMLGLLQTSELSLEVGDDGVTLDRLGLLVRCSSVHCYIRYNPIRSILNLNYDIARKQGRSINS